jgi:hypothetical protein
MSKEFNEFSAASLKLKGLLFSNPEYQELLPLIRKMDDIFRRVLFEKTMFEEIVMEQDLESFKERFESFVGK